MMFQESLYSSLRSFSSQIYLLSSVAFLSPLFLNDCLWPYNLRLKVPSVRPTYFFSSDLVFTVAS